LALENERDIVRTMYQFSHSLDYGFEPAFLDCFTDTAMFRTERRGKPGRLCKGQQELRAYFAQHTHAPDLYHKHLMVEPQVLLAGNEARVDSYFVRIDEHPDGSYVRAFGRYRDRLMKCADGRWRIVERLAEVEDLIQRQYPKTSP
jgi:ketosteroid isomerase-like protein